MLSGRWKTTTIPTARRVSRGWWKVRDAMWSTRTPSSSLGWAEAILITFKTRGAGRNNTRPDESIACEKSVATCMGQRFGRKGHLGGPHGMLFVSLFEHA